jgi:oxalate---CoA ligase
MATLNHLLNSAQQDDPAIIIPGDSTLTISHSQLIHQCKTIQKQLAELAIGHGTAVSISLPNSYEFVPVFLAICWQRAIAAPLNPAYKEQEVQFYIDDLDAAAIVVPKGACEQGSPAVLAARKRNAAVIECYTEDGGQVRFDVKELGELEGKGKRDVEDAREDDVALVLHTSGTTGKPKAVGRENLGVMELDLPGYRSH